MRAKVLSSAFHIVRTNQNFVCVQLAVQLTCRIVFRCSWMQGEPLCPNANLLFMIIKSEIQIIHVIFNNTHQAMK